MDQLIADRLRDREWTSEGKVYRQRTIDKSKRGNNLWYVVERTVDGGEPTRFIALDLLGMHRGHGAGYKDICESMGPTEMNCPLRFFDLVPEPAGTYGPEWRQRVRGWHASTAKERKRLKEIALEAGQKWELKQGLVSTVDRNAKLHYVRIERMSAQYPSCVYGVCNDGVTYRIRKKHLVRLLGEKEIPAAMFMDETGMPMGDKSTTQEN